MIHESLMREAAFHDDRFANARHERGKTSVFYRTSAASRRAYFARIERYAPNSRALEFGCGPGGTIFRMAPIAQSVTGIDISAVAVEQARSRGRADGHANASFSVCDAQATSLAAGAFDLIYGAGILHHLVLDAAFHEITRLLTDSGRAIFLEPLGHNAAINAFRRLTPSLRTMDEHPLLIEDLHRARRHFGLVDVQFFHCTSLAAVALSRTPAFERAIDLLDWFDGRMFALLPGMRRYAWIAVMELGDPLRATDR